MQYTITVNNIGTGPTGSPVTIDEYLPAGFTFVSKDSVIGQRRGRDGRHQRDHGQPLQPQPAALQRARGHQRRQVAGDQVHGQGAGQRHARLVLQHLRRHPGRHPADDRLAGVHHRGRRHGKIGDTIFRDWDGNGAQDAGEEGIAGVTVTLTKPGGGTVTTTTDANGQYLFTSLAAGAYTVSVPAPGSGGVPAGYVLTADPDGSPYDLSFVKNLATR